MKFVSAGHCNVQGPNYAPGAVGVNGRKEADETVKMRNAVVGRLKGMGYTDIIQDADGETLAQYLFRIKTSTGSMVCEFHFNAGPPGATGVEVIVEEDADKMDISCAKEIADMISKATGLKKRGKDGVISEKDSHRGRLGLMREEGIVVLVELAFISNADDMARYDKNFETIAHGMAQIIAQYDQLIQ